MGTLKNGIMSGFSGRLGNLVVYEMFGKTVVRTLPSVKQKKASGKRKQYQDDFRYVMKWMQIVKPMIDRCWPVVPPHKTPFKQAFSTNLKSYREMGRPNSYNWLKVSHGSLPCISGFSFTAENQLFKLHWDTSSASLDANPLDQVHIYFVNAKQEEGSHQIYSVNRNQGHLEVELKYWQTSDPIVAFIAVSSFNNASEMSSDTLSLLIQQ